MGTHPIFESDFDCLTVFSGVKRQKRHNGRVACGREVFGGDGAPFNPDWEILDYDVSRSPASHSILNLRSSFWRCRTRVRYEDAWLSENVCQSVLSNPAELVLESADAFRIAANYDLYGLLQS